jgi:hypothetical protein
MFQRCDDGLTCKDVEEREWRKTMADNIADKILQYVIIDEMMDKIADNIR